MPLGNPIQKQNNTRIVSATATAGQVQFTVTGGYTINAISVYRNGVRLSNSDDFTASDGSTVSLNVAADVGDTLDFHIFDKFTVSNAIVSAASTQAISGNLNVTGSLYATTFRPDDIVTAGNANLGSLNVSGISTLGIATVSALGLDLTGTANISGVSTFKDDVTFDNGTNAGKDIVWDESDNQLEFSDDVKSSFGGANDLQIYHESSSNNSIIDNNTGQLRIQGDLIRLMNSAGSKVSLESNVDNNVELYFNNALRLTTTTSGISVSDQLNVVGLTTIGGDVSIADKIIHTGDTDTAIRFPSANQISFETAGGEGVRIDGGGRLLVGTTVARTFGGSVYAHLQLEGTTQQGSQFTVTRNTNDTYAPNISLVKTRGTSDGAVTTVQDNDQLGQIQFRGADGSDVYSVAAQIHGEVDGSPSDGTDMPGALVFGTTADGASSSTERMRIASDGDVIIGGSSDAGYANYADNLTIHGTGNEGITIRSGTSSQGAIYFSDATGSGTETYEGFLIYDHNINALTFGTSHVERLRIDSSGRLLVGTTTNSSPIGWNNNLQVAGTNAQAGISIRRDENGTGGALLVFGKSRGSLNGSTVVQDGDQIGGMYFAGADGTDVNSIAAQISVEVDGSPGSNDMPGRILFKTTTDGAASPTERMRIMQGGQVSIGNNPTVHTDTIFHIEDSGETNIKIEGSTSTLGARISLQNNDTTANSYSQYAFNDAGGQSTSAIQGINTDQTNNYGEIAFLTRNAQGSPPAERIRIDKEGRLLINKTSGSCLLDINSSHYVVTSSGKSTTGINIDGTAGNANEYGGGISFQCGSTGAGAVSALQGGADADIVGLAFFTHPTSTGSDDAVEQMRIQADGKLTINDGTYAATAQMDLRANAANTKEILTVCGQRNSNRGLKLGTMLPSTGNQNDAAICYNAQDEEGSPKGYHAQHQFQIAGDTAMTIGYQGLHRVGIGISGPASAVHVTAADMVGYFHLNSSGDNTAIVMRHNRGGLSGYSGKMIAFRGNDNTEEGSIVIGTTSTAFNTSSDYRLKENIVGLSGGVVRVKQLKPYRFNFKKTSDVTVDGFLAHEVSSVIPEAVTGTKDEVHTEDVIEGGEVVRKKGDIKPQQLDYAKLTPLLTAALQEVIVRVESLETENTALKARVAALESS